MMQGWIELDFWQFIGLLALGAVFGIAIGHQIGLVLRARSGWAGLDVLALPLLGGILAAVLSHFFRARAFGVVSAVLLAVFVLFLISLYVSGAIGISRGRSEIKSVQRVSSIVLWSGAGIGVLLAILYTTWVRSASLEDLRESYLNAAPAGDVLAVQGESTGRFDYSPAFITNPATGKTLPLGGDVGWSGVHLSADGRTAVWSRRASARFGSTQVQLIVGQTDGSGIRETDIFYYEQTSSSALSPDGSLFALVNNDGLVNVRNLQSGSEIAAFKVKLGWGGKIRFLTNDRLRIYAEHKGSHDVKIFEYDLRGRALVEHPPAPAGTNFWSMSVSPDGEKFLARVLNQGVTPGRTELREIRSGSRLATIESGERSGFATFAADGRIVSVSVAGKQAILRALSADGVEERTIVVGEARGIRLGGEISNNQFVVITSAIAKEVQPAKGDTALSLVDIGTGQVKSLGKESARLWPAALWLRSRANQPLSPGSIATRLFYTMTSDKRSALIMFNPLTGERKLIAGKER